jgi:hypothetical protein
MATQWGRKETIIWPPHVPMLSYTAVATALLCTCLLVWRYYTSALEPLQKSYMTEYIRSEAGGMFNAHESYRLLYLGGGRGKPRLAFPVDFVAGQTVLPTGKTLPVALSPLAVAQGYHWPFRAAEQKLADQSTRAGAFSGSSPSASSRAEPASLSCSGSLFLMTSGVSSR